MALVDAYSLSLVSVEIWGIILAFTSTGFIIGGLMTSRFGLGKNPVKTLLLANLFAWINCIGLTSIPSILLTGI